MRSKPITICDQPTNQPTSPQPPDQPTHQPTNPPTHPTHQPRSHRGGECFKRELCRTRTRKKRGGPTRKRTVSQPTYFIDENASAKMSVLRGSVVKNMQKKSKMDVSYVRGVADIFPASVFCVRVVNFGAPMLKSV